MKLTTKNGHDFFVVSSLLQKSLRRGDLVLASRSAFEFLPKYSNYLWNRLLVVSAEDCSELVTGEVMACYLAWCKINEDRSHAQRDRPTDEDAPPWNMRKGSRVFFQKALVLLAKSHHSRDADELGHLVIDRLPDKVFKDALRDAANAMTDEDYALEIPDYVYDLHTRRGKRAGSSKQDFLRAEHAVMDSTMFTNFDELVQSWGYVEPDLDLGTS